MPKLYVIEARNPETGQLDLTEPQPEKFFGMAAIQGIDDNAMARVVFKHDREAVLRGDQVALWPSLLDPRFIARVKTW